MNITILTVDTDYTRTLLNSKLEEQNYKVIAEANNYEEAINLYKSCLPDIVIADIDLGNTSKGLSFINTLLDIDPYVKIIALSTFFQDTTKARLLKKGIDLLVMKPYQPAHIWEKIDYICENNDIAMLRSNREKIVQNATSSKGTHNKGDQLNNQITSLRDQISRNRNSKNEVLGLSSTEDYPSSNVDDFSFEDFSIDIESPIEIDTSFNNYKTEFSSDLYKTNESDNAIGLDVLLHDTEEGFSNTYTTLSITHEYTESKTNDFYLGLPVFIDRDLNDSIIEEYQPQPSNTQNGTRGTLFQKILKKKGGK